MSDHEFWPRTFTISLVSVMLFCILVTAAYVDMNMCPYNRLGGSASIEAHEDPPMSVFASNFYLFPCHIIDVLVWVYVACLTVFIAHKWWMYKKMGFHYFLLDFCYFHNLSLTVFLLFVIGSVGWYDGPTSFGLPSETDGFVIYNVIFDVKPVGVSVATLSHDTRKLFAFVFFALFGGSLGALLWAIKMWSNALLFHSEDKMTSVYLHLAPPTVQTLLLHAAMKSTATRTVSTLRDMIYKSATFNHVLISHLIFFCLWQLVYHLVNETRAKQRKRKACKMTMISGGSSAATSERVTAYTWLMAKPPGGKKGALYRLVTMFGEKELPTKVMFSVVQLGLHIAFLAIGYVPMRMAINHFDVWPLLVYIAGFFILSIWNAACLMTKWIHKLERTIKELQPNTKMGSMEGDGDSTAAE